MTTWWWLSFCDNTRPVGDRFVGLALVEAHSMVEATKAAWARGCNPGGEVFGYEVPAKFGPPPTGYQHRLLTRSDAEEMQAIWTPDDPGISTLAEVQDEEVS